jgi:hypothetical protein
MPLVNYNFNHLRCSRQATVNAPEVAGGFLVIIFDIRDAEGKRIIG